MDVVVQHVSASSERVENVKHLSAQLRPWATSFTVVDDKDRNGPLWSWRQCLALASPERPLFTIQDDCHLTSPVQVLDELAALRPNEIIGLSFLRKTAVDIYDRGVRWIEVPGTLWTLGVIYPPGMPARILEWMDQNIPQDYPHDDRAFGAFLDAYGMSAFCPVPSIVQHGNMKSTLGHNPPQARIAHVTWSEGIDYSDLTAVKQRLPITTLQDIYKAVDKRKGVK